MNDRKRTRNSPSPADDRTAREALRAALTGLRPRVTMERDGLVLIALEPAKPPRTQAAPRYLRFEEAAGAGAVEIREVNSGTVPVVEAVTRDRPVLVFAGDTIVGGKQNRFINVTIWLPAAKATRIPVTCLELGRWDAGHAMRFGAGRKADYALRSMVNVQVSEQVRSAAAFGAPMGDTEAFAADQGAVWHEISQRETRAGRTSPTAALHDLYEEERDEAEPLAATFPCPIGATGLAVAVGGRIVALELFDNPTTLAASWPRLVESAVSAHLDHARTVAAGLAHAPAHRYPDTGALSRMLDRAGAALDGASVGRSIGEGLDIRLAGHRIAGSALVRRGHVIHAELFRVAA